MQLTQGTDLQGGKYRILDILGQGGFGITYLAEQTALGRKVAVKEFFMKEHCNRDTGTSRVSVPSVGSRELVDRFKQKFLKEARMIASFDNSHIIRIHDVFEENGTAYYVMEYLEGKSLAAVVKEQGVMPEATAVSYIRQVADALAEVHANKLLHLDIKPANIMLGKKGQAVLIDFGISKHYDEGGSQTSSATVGISEGYAPLEQYEAGALKEFTPATDIYALGATLFCLLAGARPPKASEVMNYGLPALPEGVSPAVRAAVESAMQPAVRMRPQSIEEFLLLFDSKNEKGEMRKLRVIEQKSNSFEFLQRAEAGSTKSNEKSGGCPVENIKGKGKNENIGAETLPLFIEGVPAGGGSSVEDSAETFVADTVISSEREKSPQHANKEILPPSGRQNDNSVSARQKQSSQPTGAKGNDNAGGNKSNRMPWIILLLFLVAGACTWFAMNSSGSASKREFTDVKDTVRAIEEDPEVLLAHPPAEMPAHGTINSHEWVDLGLPSGLKWASCNVGASAPEDYGDYYAWGETEAKKESKIIDIGINISGTKYDVAHVKWGGTWRMPTKADFEELIDNCEWEWTTRNEVNGCKVISKKNGESIFIPAPGRIFYGEIPFDGLWSATTDDNHSDMAYCFYFDEGYFQSCNRGMSQYSRNCTHFVRPVSE